MDTEAIKKHWIDMLELIGDDPQRVGLHDTPKRIANMYEELFRGYDKDQEPKVTIFPNGQDSITYNEMIIDTGRYSSLCEHHMMPFFGNYWFAYIPSEKGSIVGLSKVARVIDYFCARLQVQERLTQQVVEYLWEKLTIEGVAPLGMGLVMTGEHLCKRMRGAKKEGLMTTIVLKGNFKDEKTRAEFLSFAKQ